MKKFLIIIPVYNDWESLKKLLNQIDETIKEYDFLEFQCIIVNDASNLKEPKIIKPKNIKFIKIMNMKENRGHARCNAFGIRYAFQNEEFDYLILMDGDGEDRPIEIKSFIDKIQNEPDKSVVAKRVKRSEGLIFQNLYTLHKLITLIFTGKKINFGNYSCLTKMDVEKIFSKASLWSSYSGTIKKYIKNYNEINSSRGLRYFGPSKMSLINLIVHSFSIIAVFRYQVLLRSCIIMSLMIYLSLNFGINLFFFKVILSIFCLIIFIVSMREKKAELLNSQENLNNEKIVTH
tara:strand:+ start:1512 stop:2384 length:873 start_codon:yes stop_codon:yes gene_type:complete